VLVVTGFVAPGFFLADDRRSVSAPPHRTVAPAVSTTSASPSRHSWPTSKAGAAAQASAVLDQFIRKLTVKDVVGALMMACHGAPGKDFTDGVQTAIAADVDLTHTPPTSGYNPKLGSTVRGSVNGKPYFGLAYFDETNSCIADFFLAPDPTPPSPSPST
jgi:hypothetical protein